MTSTRPDPLTRQTAFQPRSGQIQHSISTTLARIRQRIALVFMFAVATPLSAQDLYTVNAFAANGGVAAVAGPSAVAVSVTKSGFQSFAEASAEPGRIVLSARSAVSFTRVRSEQSSDSNAFATVRLQRFDLDPTSAGVMAFLDFHLVATGSAVASSSPSVFVSGSSARLNGTPSGEFSAFNGDPVHGYEPALSLQPVDVSDSVELFAGNIHTINFEVQSSSNLQLEFVEPGGDASSQIRAELTYSVRLIEDRRHWALPTGSVITPGPGSSWIEGATPDASAWAVFNRVAPRILAMSLDRNQTWRGLIVDGEQVTLDLGGNTLTLGPQGPSLKTYSLLLGEGRGTPTSLVLLNGTLAASNDVVVGGVGGVPATLTLDRGMVLTHAFATGNGKVVVGQLGTGHLVVKDSSRLITDSLLIAPNSSVTGSLVLTGDGSRIEATNFSLAERGVADASVRDGAVLQSQGFKMAERAGSQANLLIDGVGSQLVLTGAAAGIGRGGRATLEVTGGGAILANASVIEVGSGNPALFSVLRISDAGSRLSNGAVQVNAGGLFQLRDGAVWTEGVNGLSVIGGEALVQNAQARFEDVTIAGVVVGGQLKSSGSLIISNGAVVTVRDNVNVNEGGQLRVLGTGSRLTGFANLQLDGLLAVDNGGEIFGNKIGTSKGSVILGNRGSIHLDVNLGGELRPGNSPGELTIDGNLTLLPGSRVVLELAGPAAGTQHDLLHVTGNLDLQGGEVELEFLDGFAPLAGQQFNLLDVGGVFTGTATIQVRGLLPGWQYSTRYDTSTHQFSLDSLNAGVAAVPELPSWALLGGGLLLMVGIRRRRLV